MQLGLWHFKLMMSLCGYILIVSQGASVIRKWWSLMLIALALNTSYLIVGFCNYNFMLIWLCFTTDSENCKKCSHGFYWANDRQPWHIPGTPGPHSSVPQQAWGGWVKEGKMLEKWKTLKNKSLKDGYERKKNNSKMSLLSLSFLDWHIAMGRCLKRQRAYYVSMGTLKSEP